MILSRKWKYGLFCCLVFFACKSTDCGCPMAEAEITSMKKEQENKPYQKEWKKITKGK